MKLLPRKDSFYDQFDQLAHNLVTIAEELRGLQENLGDYAARQARVKELEHACDDITHSLVTQMHATFVTPLDKEDIAALAKGMDDVADEIDSVAIRFGIYRITELREGVLEMTDLLIRAVREVEKAVPLLRKGRQRDTIIACCREIHRIENESDAVYQRAESELFSGAVSDPLTVIKWKEIYECLEEAVDRCEDLSNVLEGIQLKYA